MAEQLPCCAMSAMLCSPAHAMYFATYEQAKQLLGGNRQGYQWLPTAAAGAIATIVNDGFMTPVDVVKQRLQVAHSPYKGLADCTRQILRQEGVGALYKSYRWDACSAVCHVIIVALLLHCCYIRSHDVCSSLRQQRRMQLYRTQLVALATGLQGCSRWLWGKQPGV